MITWIGADVGKTSVIVFASGNLYKVANDPKKLQKSLKMFGEGCALVVEGSGGYSRAIIDAALGQGITVYAVNPADFRHYRDALSYRAKTDPIDAELLARYGEKEFERLRVYRPASPETELARSLLGMRHLLVKARTSLALAFSSMPRHAQKELPGLFKDLDQLNVRIRDIEEKLLAHAKTRPVALALSRIKGIGLHTAVALDWVFDKAHFASSDQLVAFVGLDIRIRQSGKYQGQSKLTKRGDALVRELLIDAANSLRRSRAWQPLFLRYALRGLSKTAVNAIVARKLLRIAFSIVVSGEPYDELKVAGIDHSWISNSRRSLCIPCVRLPKCMRDLQPKKRKKVLKATGGLDKTL